MTGRRNSASQPPATTAACEVNTMIRLEEIEKIPLIDTHMHRVHPARAPEWGSLGGGYIPGPGQERHGRQTVLYGMILEKLRQRFGMAEDASPEEVERERFLRYGKDPKGYYADLIGECNVAMHCVETGSPIGGPLYSQEEKAFFGASGREAGEHCSHRPRHRRPDPGRGDL